MGGGGRRDNPEYFGCGRVGEVWRDPEVPEDSPKYRWRWYCTVEDYIPFPTPVPWKRDGRLLEDNPPNAFRNGVRTLSLDAFEEILEAAGLSPRVIEGSAARLPSMPPLTEVEPAMSETLLLTPVPARAAKNAGVSNASVGAARRSRHSKVIGDRAEEIVLNRLRMDLPPAAGRTLRWVARVGLRPGWDIQYYDGDQLVAVEVKGTSGPLFGNVEVTTQEWKAAESLGNQYWLYLVADCLTRRPRISQVRNPFALSRSGYLRASPLVWRLEAAQVVEPRE